MTQNGRLFWILTGAVLGIVGAFFWTMRTPAAHAASDRHEDYVMCTGTIQGVSKMPLDAVWFLDYKSGRLLATVVDRVAGKVTGWGELDLSEEFGIAPRANVHFVMTTGEVGVGQSVLYVAETTSGKFGVYNLVNRADGKSGVAIKRLDMSTFRAPAKGE
jgi:hypothetical protein